MYILISKQFREYVTGIFSTIENYNDYISRIPDDLTTHLTTIKLELSYPFYLTEDHEGFNFYTEEEIKAKMATFIAQMKQRDEDWCYTNLYRICEDFEPKYPGDDGMGMINHHHVSNTTLEYMMECGFNGIW